MTRRKRDYTRDIQQDSVYKSELITKFINKIMISGKKSLAENIVYGALVTLGDKVKSQPLDAFKVALKNASPLMQVKSRRVGGSTYQVPMEVKIDKAEALAMKWLITFARSKKGKSMVENLSAELIDAYNKIGNAIKKREDTHKMAEANKAFAHFRW